jgi:two-component system, OmpR family, KDP operon response regulator KdpE
MTSILLVEDDPKIVRAIVPALEVSGLSVTVTRTARAAMDQVDAGTWDVLVVDLGLPDLNGKSVIRHLRKRRKTPVVVVSAQHSREELHAAHDAGADCFLHKPFRTPDLVECISKLVDNSERAKHNTPN